MQENPRILGQEYAKKPLKFVGKKCMKTLDIQGWWWLKIKYKLNKTLDLP